MKKEGVMIIGRGKDDSTESGESTRWMEEQKWILLAQAGGGCSVWVGMRHCLVHTEHDGCPGHDIQRSI